MTLGEYLENWISLKSTALAPRTIGQYKRLIAHCNVIANVELDKVTILDLSKPIKAAYDVGHKRTSEQIYVMLRTALGDAVEMRLIKVSPIYKIIRPKCKYEEHSVFTTDETRSFIRAAFSDRQCIALLLLVLCGLRRGECLGLMWSDIDFNTRIMSIERQKIRLDNGDVIVTDPKSDSGKRQIPLPELVFDLLQSNRGIGGYIVRVSQSGLRSAMKRVCDRAGVPNIGLHGLRHTFATNCVRSGADMKSLQKVMGHAKITTTARYYTHTDTDLIMTMIDRSMRYVV